MTTRTMKKLAKALQILRWAWEDHMNLVMGVVMVDGLKPFPMNSAATAMCMLYPT